MNVATAKADIVADVVGANLADLPSGHVLDHEPSAVPGPFALTVSFDGGGMTEDAWLLVGRLYAQVNTDPATVEATMADVLTQLDATLPAYIPRGSWSVRRATEIKSGPLVATVVFEVPRDDF